MSRLKKLVLAAIVLIFMLPIFVLLYSTLLFGNSFVDQQWLSAFSLFVVGLFLLQVIGFGMK